MRDLKTWTGGVEVYLKVRRQFKKKMSIFEVMKNL